MKTHEIQYVEWIRSSKTTNPVVPYCVSRKMINPHNAKQHNGASCAWRFKQNIQPQTPTTEIQCMNEDLCVCVSAQSQTFHYERVLFQY